MNISNRKEVNNAGWIIGGRIVQMILSFVVSILTARFLGPGNYGLINYAGAYVAFFTSFCTLGINYVIIKDFSDNPDEVGKSLGTAFVLRAISSLFSAITIVAIVGIVDKNETTTMVVTALCSLSLVFQIFNNINQWFQSRYQSKVSSIATLIAYMLTSVLRILLLAWGKDVRWFAFATSVDYIVEAVCLMIAYRRYHAPKLQFSVSKGKQLLNKSYHYILSGMMVAIYQQTDKLMLKQMICETEVGYYSLASNLCNMWVFVLAAIIDSVYPTIISLYKTDKIEFERKNRQLYGIVFYISVFVSVLFLIFGKPAVNILYGETYYPAVMPLKIITWYTAFSYLGVARNAWIVCENKQKYLKYMYLTAAIMNVILNSFLIPVLGAAGAALASLVTQITTSLGISLIIPGMRPNAILMLQAISLKDLWSKVRKSKS